MKNFKIPGGNFYVTAQKNRTKQTQHHLLLFYSSLCDLFVPGFPGTTCGGQQGKPAGLPSFVVLSPAEHHLLEEEHMAVGHEMPLSNLLSGLQCSCSHSKSPAERQALEELVCLSF